MAYAPHVRVQWGGTIYDAPVGGNAVEIWSNTLSLADVGAATAEAAQGAIASSIKAFHSRLDTGISANCAIEYVKVNRIDAAGHYAEDTTNVVYDTARGALGTKNIIQGSLRVSIDDGSRNPRARGGWYIPCFGRAVGTDYRLSTANRDEVLSSTGTLLTELNNIPSISVVVASSVDGSLRTVSRLRVGRVVDVIRSRRNALLEDYAAAAVV